MLRLSICFVITLYIVILARNAGMSWVENNPKQRDNSSIYEAWATVPAEQAAGAGASSTLRPQSGWHAC
jgi:hypothetical protein